MCNCLVDVIIFEWCTLLLCVIYFALTSTKSYFWKWCIFGSSKWVYNFILPPCYIVHGHSTPRFHIRTPTSKSLLVKTSTGTAHQGTKYRHTRPNHNTSMQIWTPKKRPESVTGVLGVQCVQNRHAWNAFTASRIGTHPSPNVPLMVGTHAFPDSTLASTQHACILNQNT